MTKQEFSELLTAAVKFSGKTEVELVTRMQKTRLSIYFIYKCKYDTTLKSIMELLEAINCHLVIIQQDKSEVKLYNIGEVSEFIVQILKRENLSTRQLGEKYSFTPTAISRMMRGNNLKITNFLNILSINNCSLYIDANA